MTTQPIRMLLVSQGKVTLLDEVLTHDRLVALVGGWPVEMITLSAGKVSMYVQGEGKYRGLPSNDLATRIGQVAGALRDGDWIAGPALITGPLVEGGRDTSVPADVEAAILSMQEHQIGEQP